MSIQAVHTFETGLDLAHDLKNNGLTLLGTIRKNRIELPPELVFAKNREIFSSMFAFGNETTLVSYCPKKGKVVVLLSSTHDQPEVNDLFK